MKEDIEPELLGITYEHPDYEIINYIYKYHPYFSNKNEIVCIYKKYGIELLKNMIYIAKESKKIYKKIYLLEEELEQCKNCLEKFKSGKFTVEI